MKFHHSARGTSSTPSHPPHHAKHIAQPPSLRPGTSPLRHPHHPTPNATTPTTTPRARGSPTTQTQAHQNDHTPPGAPPTTSRRLLLTLTLALATAPALPAFASDDDSPSTSSSSTSSSSSSSSTTPSLTPVSNPATADPTGPPPPTPTAAPAPTSPDADIPPLDSRWWEHDSDRWLELATPTDLQRFILTPLPPPAPAAPNPPRLRAVEFYAKWCPVCAAKAPELTTAASDPSLAALCAFARVDIDALPREHLAELGIRHVPTMIVFSPDGYKLIDFLASEAALREAVGSLAPVFQDPTAAIPAAYQADLANLPQPADDGYLMEEEWYEGEGQEGGGGGVTLADGGLRGEAVKLSA